MAKKYFQKALSVGLSLALCASMVAPGFAASFKDLQNAIDGKTDAGEQLADGSGWGYGGKIDGTDNYAVEAKDGDGTRTVTLYEDVEFDKDKGDVLLQPEGFAAYYGSGIVIGKKDGDDLSKNITLDLNGNNIDLNPRWTLSLEDSNAESTEPGTLVNRMEETDPRDDTKYNPGELKLVGSWSGYDNPYEDDIAKYGINPGNVIWVEQEASLTLKDSSDEAAAGAPGKITGGVDRQGASGVGVVNEGTFVMDGGEVSGNNNGHSGGVRNAGSFTMNGGKITGNMAGVQSEGYGGDSFTLNGGEIIGNIGVYGNGNITGSAREIGENSETVYPEGAFIDENGNLAGKRAQDPVVWGIRPSVTKTDNGDGTVTIKTDDSKGTTTENTITVPEGGSVTLDGKGNTTISGGSSIEGKDGEDNKTVTTYPNGATIDKSGNITGEGVTKTEKDNSVEVDKGGDDNFTVNPPKGGDDGEKVTVNPDGSVDIPNGGTKDDGKTETTYPDGGKINPDGTVEGEGTTVTKDKGTGDVTIDDGKGGKTEVTVPDDKKDDVDVDSEGKTHVPGGSEQPVEVKKDGEDEGTKVTAPEDTDIVVNPDGSVDVPAGGKVTDKDGNEYELPEGGKITEDGKVVDKDGNLVEPKKDDNGSGGSQGGGNGVTGGNGEADVIVIDGVEVPLSGLVSVEDVLSVLYRLTEGVDGGRDEVVAWAVENGIIDEETDVEEIVTVAALRAILANYARAFELDVDVSALATLAGEDDDIVMNCDEVIDEFFTKAEEDETA